MRTLNFCTIGSENFIDNKDKIKKTLKFVKQTKSIGKIVSITKEDNVIIIWYYKSLNPFVRLKPFLFKTNPRWVRIEENENFTKLEMRIRRFRKFVWFKCGIMRFCVKLHNLKVLIKNKGDE